MIAAIVDGGNTTGLLQYLVGPGRANEHECPHVVAGSGVIARRWGAWESLSPAQGYEIARFVDQFMSETGTRPLGSQRVFNQETGKRETLSGPVANHVWHCSLSVHPDEGPLSDEKWQAIATDLMTAMGFTDADSKAPCRWVAVRHGAAKNGGDHIHIVANTVREDGTKWNRWQDQPKVQKACNAIEHRYGLRIVEAREHARGARADSAADLRASARRGQSRTDRDALEKRVRAAATSANSEVDFILRLRELGVRARPRFAKGRTDVVVGYSVALRTRRGERSQWYGGGRLARDLTLARVRTRWPDTPVMAQQAVDAWREAWRGRPPRGPAAISTAQWRARTEALEVWRSRLAGIDPMDAQAMADATTDIAGVLSAAAVSWPEGPERDMLDRAAHTVGCVAQTKTRTAQRRPTGDALVLAAGLLSTAHMRPGFSSGVMVALSALRLADALGDLYAQARQTQTARDMSQTARGAFIHLHAGLAPLDAAAYARLAWQAGRAQADSPVARSTRDKPAPNPWITTPDPAPEPEPVSVVAVASAAEQAATEAGMSPQQFDRIRRMNALGKAEKTSAGASHRPVASPTTVRRPVQEPKPRRGRGM